VIFTLFISIFVILMASGCDLVGNSMVDYFLDNTGTVSVTGVAGKTLSVKMSDETILIPPGEPSTIGVTLSNPRNFDIRYEIAGAPAGKDIAARQTRSNEIEVDIGGAAENDEYNLTLALQSSDGLRNFLPYTIRLKCVSFETGLFDFKVNGATPPAFDPNGGFTANVPYRRESAILQGIAVDPNAVVEIFSGSGAAGAALATGTHTVEIERALEEENNYFYIRITAPSSLTQGYVITVYRGKNFDNDITDFYFYIGGKKYGVEIGEETHAIAVTVPYGTDITRMKAQAIHTGDSISPPDDPEAERSYAAPVTYTVTAANGATQEYTVTATVAKIASIGAVSGNLAFARTGSDISGDIKAAITPVAGTDAIGTAITLDPADYSVDALTPSSTGTTVSAILRVPADKSSTGAEIVQEFEVYIKSDAKEITDFYFEIGGKKYGIGAGTQSGSGTISGAAVTVAVPYGTVLSGLSPTVALSHSEASIAPPAGTTWGSSSSKTYMVTAEDGATQDYTVTASVAKIASIGAVSENLTVVKTEDDISGDIKAAITPVAGTDAIGTAIVLDPSDYSVDTLTPPSTGITMSAILRVPADKNSTGAEIAQEFEVYIKSDAKEITDFYFEIGGKKYSGEISGTDITVIVPYGTDLSGLSPTVILNHNGASTTPPAGTAWGSVSLKDYTVTAEDGTTQAYTVNIKPGIDIGGIVDPSIPVLTFSGIPPNVNAGQPITIAISGGTVEKWYIDISGPINSTENAGGFNAPATQGFYIVNVIATVDGVDYAGSFPLTVE
jgi:hypothetical protein